MNAARLRIIGCLLLALAVLLGSSGQTANQRGTSERLIGAWHLVRIDTGDPPVATSQAAPAQAATPQPTGMLIYTRDGHMSVQLMYPASAATLSNQYVLNGYEASFGTYTVNQAAHTVTHHVQASITRDNLVGQDLPRKIAFTADGHLLIQSTNPAEHWSVTWQHD